MKNFHHCEELDEAKGWNNFFIHIKYDNINKLWSMIIESHDDEDINHFTKEIERLKFCPFCGNKLRIKERK